MKKILSLAIALIMCVAVFASCAAGKSAYDLAVENGFDGTVEEWLESLKGADGAQGDKGDKGETGDKGADGAQGTKGDKGDAGDKGVQGDAGVNGEAGAPGVQGDKGDKGDQGAQGDKGETGDAGVNGLVPLLRVNAETKEWEVSYDNGTSWISTGVKSYIDVYINELGYWVINGVETEWFAGSQKDENGAEIEIAVKELAVVGATKNADNVYELSTEYWSTQTTAPKLQLTYILSNDRTGVIDVNPGMVIDGEYDLTKGGTYEATIKYLGTAIDVKIKVTSYKVGATECYVQPAGSGEFEIIYTGPDGVSEAVKPSTGKADYTVVGEYSVVFNANADYGWEEALEYTVKVNPMMVYYQDFNNITATGTHDILEELGWKALYKTSSTIPDAMKDVGLNGGVDGDFNSNNVFEIKDGALYINTTNGGSAMMQLVSDEYMDLAGEGDYTIEYTFTYHTVNGSKKATTSYARLGIKFGLDTKSGYNFAMFAGSVYRFNGAHQMELHIPKSATAWTYTGVYNEVGKAVQGNRSYGYTFWMSRLFDASMKREDSATTAHMADRQIKVRIQVVNNNSNYFYDITEDDLFAAGVDRTANIWDPKYPLELALAQDITPGGYYIWVNDVFMSNGADCNAGTMADKWNYLVGDALMFGPAAKMEMTIDDFAIWTGCGPRPTDTSTSAYEALVGTTAKDSNTFIATNGPKA